MRGRMATPSGSRLDTKDRVRTNAPKMDVSRNNGFDQTSMLNAQLCEVCTYLGLR